MRARGRRPDVRAENASAGISTAVTKLLVSSIALMISAAVRSSFFVFRMRPAGCCGVSVGSPCTSGITATPVSNPDNPSASFGNRMIAIAPIITGSP